MTTEQSNETCVELLMRTAFLAFADSDGGTRSDTARVLERNPDLAEARIEVLKRMKSDGPPKTQQRRFFALAVGAELLHENRRLMKIDLLYAAYLDNVEGKERKGTPVPIDGATEVDEIIE